MLPDFRKRSSVRKHLEQGLNQDLSKVRIHDNAEADKLAKSVNAIAFTSGQDIFFQSDKYDPNSQTGLELLAHEVTHTVQQSKGQVTKGIDPDAGLEQEAQDMGKKLSTQSPQALKASSFPKPVASTFTKAPSLQETALYIQATSPLQPSKLRQIVLGETSTNTIIQRSLLGNLRNLGQKGLKGLKSKAKQIHKGVLNQFAKAKGKINSTLKTAKKLKKQVIKHKMKIAKQIKMNEKKLGQVAQKYLSASVQKANKKLSDFAHQQHKAANRKLKEVREYASRNIKKTT